MHLLALQVREPAGPPGAGTCWPSRCAHLLALQVRAPAGPTGARTCWPSRCVHLLALQLHAPPPPNPQFEHLTRSPHLLSKHIISLLNFYLRVLQSQMSLFLSVLFPAQHFCSVFSFLHLTHHASVLMVHTIIKKSVSSTVRILL